MTWGDAMRAGDVRRAVAGQDAVVVAPGSSQDAFALRLGARRTTPRDVCEVGTRPLLEALPEGGSMPFVVAGAFGVGKTRAQLPFAFEAFYRYVLREQISDKERREALPKASDTDYVLVRPVALTDAPAAKA